MSDLPVLIIGAGLGGLTLASALRKHDISYQVFERDSAEYRIAQGYRITLSQVGRDGLKAAMTPEDFELFEKTCGEFHYTAGQVDGPSGKVVRRGLLGLLNAGGLGMIGSLLVRYFGRRLLSWRWYLSWIISNKPKHPTVPRAPFSRHPTDRRTLRSLLLKPHAEHVTFDRTFASYTVTEDDVTAHFADGSSARGCLLVGADGVRSKVAKQLLGDLHQPPVDLGTRVIYGKTPLESAVEAGLLPVIRKGVAFVTDRRPEQPRLTLVMEPMRFSHPDSPENYIFWALTVPASELPGGQDSGYLDGQAAKDVSLQLTQDWDERVKIVMNEQRLSETAMLKLTSSSPAGAPVWDTDRRVTLLGDAIHSMPPTGGSGANTAIYDAALLAHALRDASPLTTGGWARSVIRSYEDAMRYNIGDIVGLACLGAGKLFGTDVELPTKAW